MIDILRKVRVVHSWCLVISILPMNKCPHNIIFNILPLEIIPRGCAGSSGFLGYTVTKRRGRVKNAEREVC